MSTDQSPVLSPVLSEAPIELRNQTYEDLTELMQQLGEKRYRGEQLFRWVHARGVTDLDQMTDVSRTLRARLRGENLVRVAELQVDKVQLSADGTRKLRLKTADNRLIESANGMVIAITFSLTSLTGVSGRLGNPNSLNGMCERIKYDVPPFSNSP